MFNIRLLHYELSIAGLPVVGVSSDGQATYSRELTAEEGVIAAAVIVAHDPTKLAPDEEDEHAAAAAKVSFRQLPDWATWTPDHGKEYVLGAVLSGQTADQVETWINTNVTTLATAKTALILLGRNLVLLRDIVSLLAYAVLLLRNVAVRKVQ